MAAASILLSIKVTFSSGVKRLTYEQRYSLIVLNNLLNNRLKDPSQLWDDKIAEITLL